METVKTTFARDLVKMCRPLANPDMVSSIGAVRNLASPRYAKRMTMAVSIHSAHGHSSTHSPLLDPSRHGVTVPSRSLVALLRSPVVPQTGSASSTRCCPACAAPPLV
jgi:hypothetical protein